MLLFPIYCLISLFEILIAEIIYPLSQLNLPSFANCNSGQMLIGWPLQITKEGACSLYDFNTPSDRFYLYTLVFTNMTTDMYVYLDGVQYFYNLRQQVNNSLLVQILHYCNQTNQLMASIDIIPVQGLIFLQRILIEIASNSTQGMIYTQSPLTVNIVDLQIDVQRVRVQDNLLLLSLIYNQSLLQFTQPLAIKNTDKMELTIINDTLVCQANLTTHDLANQSLFLDIYNITFSFSADIVGQLVPLMQSIFTKTYIIQVFDTYDYEILDSIKPILYTNTYILNAGYLNYIIQIQDMRNNCQWDILTPNISLYGMTSIYYIIPYQLTNSCQWSINLPENIVEEQYNLTFEAHIYNTNFVISKSFYLNVAQDNTIAHLQYAIIVYIICMFCSFAVLIPCLLIIKKTKISYSQEESEYRQFIFSCFNEAFRPTILSDDTLTQFETRNRPMDSEQINQGQISTRPFNSNQQGDQGNTPQVENNIQSLIANHRMQQNIQQSEEYESISDESPGFQPIKSSTNQQHSLKNSNIQKSHEKIFKLGIQIPSNDQNKKQQIEHHSQFQPIPDNSPISISSDMQNQFFHSQSRINMNLSGVTPLITHHQNGTPQINDRLGFIQ